MFFEKFIIIFFILSICKLVKIMNSLKVYSFYRKVHRRNYDLKQIFHEDNKRVYS